MSFSVSGLCVCLKRNFSDFFIRRSTKIVSRFTFSMSFQQWRQLFILESTWKIRNGFRIKISMSNVNNAWWRREFSLIFVTQLCMFSKSDRRWVIAHSFQPHTDSTALKLQYSRWLQHKTLTKQVFSRKDAEIKYLIVYDDGDAEFTWTRWEVGYAASVSVNMMEHSSPHSGTKLKNFFFLFSSKHTKKFMKH